MLNAAKNYLDKEDFTNRNTHFTTSNEIFNNKNGNESRGNDISEDENITCIATGSQLTKEQKQKLNVQCTDQKALLSC